MRRVLFLAQAELLHIVRDRATLAQVLIVPMVLLGAANLVLARPRLARLVAGQRQGFTIGMPAIVRRFNLAIVAEAGLAVGVLLATGLLTAVQPAREEYARRPQPIQLTGNAESVGVRLGVAPGRPGPNEIVCA